MSLNLTAVYAGTFDPITKGHEDIIHRAIRMFDHLVIGVGVNSSKTPTFSVEERVELIQRVVGPLSSASERDDGKGGKGNPRIRVMPFSGLMVDFCRKQRANVIVRGVRALTDFEYELTIAHVNADEAKEIDTIFFPTRLGLSAVSSSVVKELARNGGSTRRYVSPEVGDAIRRKFSK